MMQTRDVLTLTINELTVKVFSVFILMKVTSTMKNCVNVKMNISSHEMK